MRFDRTLKTFTVLTLVMLAVCGSASDAFANVEATTVIRYLPAPATSQRVVGPTVKVGEGGRRAIEILAYVAQLTSSIVAGDPSAIVDAIKVEEAIRGYVTEGYDFATPPLVRLTVHQNDVYDRVVLEFQAYSESAFTGDVAHGLQYSGPAPAIVGDAVVLQPVVPQESRRPRGSSDPLQLIRGSRAVVIYPNKLQPGDYIFTFAGKEDHCQLHCVGVIHTVALTVDARGALSGLVVPAIILGTQEPLALRSADGACIDSRRPGSSDIAVLSTCRAESPKWTYDNQSHQLRSGSNCLGISHARPNEPFIHIGSCSNAIWQQWKITGHPHPPIAPSFSVGAWNADECLVGTRGSITVTRCDDRPTQRWTWWPGSDTPSRAR